MTITIRLSAQLRNYCGGVPDLRLAAPDVRTALSECERLHPALYKSVCDETGAVRRHVNIFVNSSNTRDGHGVDTKLTPGDVVTIIQAVSGG